MRVPIHIYGIDVDEEYELDLGTHEVFGKDGRVLKVFMHGNGYLAYKMRYRGLQKNIKRHRIIAEILVENPHNHQCVDHIDGDRTNNHPDNLRWVTNSQNLMNCKPYGVRDLPKGIQHHEGGYRCQIKLNHKCYRKYFKNLDDAVTWVRAKRDELHGEYARHE